MAKKQAEKVKKESGKKAKVEKKEIVPVVTREPFEIVQEKVNGMQKMLAETPVTSEDELRVASDRVSSVKKLMAYIKEQKGKLVDPAKAIIAEAGAKYDPFIKECQNAELVLKGRAKTFLDAKDAELKKQQDKIADRVERGTMNTETAVKKMESLPEAPTTIRTPDSGLKRSLRTVAAIENRELIPHEFWVVDEVRVRREAIERHNKGLPQIPGVIIKQESSIASV